MFAWTGELAAGLRRLQGEMVTGPLTPKALLDSTAP